MRVARTGFDAVVLGDGTVLAVGDDFACYPGGAMTGSERAELYDPVADVWLEVESLNKPRKTPATIVLPDGSAMVLGGLNADDISFSSTKMFTPGTRTWHDGPLMVFARAAPSAATIDGFGTLTVGETGSPDSAGTVELLDSRLSAWTLTGAPGTPFVVERLVGLSDGRVLAFGGNRRDTDYAPVTFLYNPVGGSWTPVDSPGGLGSEIVALADGAALAIGGSDGGELMGGDGSIVARVSRFEPGTGRWRPAAPMSTSRQGAQVALLDDGRVLVAGGTALEGGYHQPGQTLSSTELYDPSADSWSPVGDLIEPRRDGYARLLDDGSVLLLGGNDSYDVDGDTPWCPTPLVSVERFVPGT